VRELSEQVAARRTGETAVGVLVALRGWDPDEARARLRDAPDKSGLYQKQVADVVMNLRA